MTRYIGDDDRPISNNWVENHIRPVALGRSNWLFAGNLRAGKRAAVVMSLVHSARMSGHDPYAYLKDVLERLPTHTASRINDLLPHRKNHPRHGHRTSHRLRARPLGRWAALTRYLHDGRLPIDNNHDEQQIRPWATGRKNWLFAGTLLAGQRAATIMSLIQSAKPNGRDPYGYLKDVLTRLPMHPARNIDELLPHRWSPPG